MPIVENLKNLIGHGHGRGEHHNHQHHHNHHNKDSSQSSSSNASSSPISKSRKGKSRSPPSTSHGTTTTTTGTGPGTGTTVLGGEGGGGGRGPGGGPEINAKDNNNIQIPGPSQMVPQHNNNNNNNNNNNIPAIDMPSNNEPPIQAGTTTTTATTKTAGPGPGQGQAIGEVSPGLVGSMVKTSSGTGGGGGGGGGGGDVSKGKAEQLVKEERERRGQAPRYEGLPEGIELSDKMGDGAFSNVYKAYDRRFGHKVAVKCVRKFELNMAQKDRHLNRDVKKKPRATERANILKEVQIMRQLRHPSIVQLLDFQESKQHYFLTLELLEGGELFHQIVKLTYFSEELSRHVILQVASGIRYLHEVGGVVHRDIKPENLLFEAIPIIPSRVPKARPYDEEKEDEGEFIPGIGGGGIGKVKIADFGLSKIIWNEETMTPCGTVGYTAPEIVKDERYSKSVDMWALGCVLYTLLCGFPPFYDESINVLTEKVARGYYTFLSPWWDDISSSSKDLVGHLLNVNPDRRYTIDQFLAHPWCNEKPPAPQIDRAAVAALPPHVKQNLNVPSESPLLQASRLGGFAGNFRSPGLNVLREAFDVTYAVHRMEEEGARRRGGGKGFSQDLNEVDEEEDEEEQLEATKRKYGEGVTNAIKDTNRALKEHQLQQAIAAQNAQATGHHRQTAKEAQAAAQNYPGWGGADRKVAEAALYDGRAGTRDRGQRKKGGQFELSLNNATLLSKRQNRGGQQGYTPSPLSNLTPGSPMRVE